MAYSISTPSPSATHDAFGMANEQHMAAITKELKDYCKCVKGNAALMLGITDLGGYSGHHLDPSSCDPVEPAKIQRILHDFVQLLVAGRFKFNGKTNDWSIGFLGNRWLDMKAADYGVDYIRITFLSKKHYSGKTAWPHDKPYHISAVVEKEKSVVCVGESPELDALYAALKNTAAKK